MSMGMDLLWYPSLKRPPTLLYAVSFNRGWKPVILALKTSPEGGLLRRLVIGIIEHLYTTQIKIQKTLSMRL